MNKINYKKSAAVLLIIGGVILGLSGVSGWGWLIFFGICLVD